MQFVKGLDSLRGFAVLSVIIGHCLPDLAPGGSAGVDMFFVLSGFLITRLARNEFSTSGSFDFRAFYMRRLLRLTPALWVLSLVYILGSLIGAALQIGPGMRNALAAVIFSVTYTMNWVRAFHLGPEVGLGHTWSLAIEEQFYLVWPVGLYLLMRAKISRPVTTILGLAAASFALNGAMVHAEADVMRIYNGFDTRCGELLVGCALAFAPLRDRLPAERLGTLLAVGFLLIAVFGPDEQVRIIHVWLMPLIALSSAWLIAALYTHPMPSLEHPLLVWTGRISYGLYLWHWPIVHALAGVLPPPQATVMTLVISYVAASASYVLVEAPLLRRFKPTWAAGHASMNMPATGSVGLR
jgi:peptidoglycan/LPS O-acetylase OafA/YrhL